MKSRRFAVCVTIVALLAALGSVTTAGGKLDTVTVPGPSIEGNLAGIPTERTAQIYLPPSYDQEPERRYPSLYILHGIFDTNFTWTRPWDASHPGFNTIQALMDTGIAERAFQEMIVVVPDSDKVCHYTDSPVRGNWEQFIAEDLVDYVDKNYRTIARAGARGITGHSMGGHGAIKLGMKHPDRFGVVYGLNPSLLGWGGDVAPDNPAFASLGAIKSLEDLANAHFYVQAIVTISQCFSPNAKSPLLADLPFGPADGGLAPAQPGYDGWQSAMPIYMVPDHVDNLKKLRGVRFDSAFVEQFSHIPETSMRLSEVLAEHGIEHTFEMYNGDHRNRLWGRQGRLYTEMLPYFSDLLESGRAE